MVWSRVRPSFLAAVCGCLVGGVSIAPAEPMGDLGGADRLVVRGPSAETAASLRQGLLDDGDLYWLGIPTADREPYLAALRTRVPLALEAAGYPEPRVAVTVGPGPDGNESVLIDVVAGERLTAGAIRVTGIPDDMARRLVNHLQEPHPPGDAVPETITLPDGSEKVLWFDAKGEPAKPGRPAWTPGDPAPCGERCARDLLGAVAGFFSCEGYLSLDGWGMATGGSARCAFQIEPVTCNAEGWTIRRVGDDLVIETTDADGHQEIWLDPASGRPRKLVCVAESNRWEILCDSGAGLVAAAVAGLRERAGKNLADSHRPVSSAARFGLANRGLLTSAVRLVTAKTTGTTMDDDAVAQYIESLQAAVDGDGLAAVDATVTKGIRELLAAAATDAPKSLAIPLSPEEENAHVRSLFATRTAAMTTARNGVPVAPPIDDQIRPALMTQYSAGPLIGRELGRVAAAAAGPLLRMLELKMGRDAAQVAAARAAVLMVCTADQAAAARELARMPAASLWTPELESLCAAFGPQGRNLDRRAREALAYLHGVAGDTAWSVAAYRRLLAETEEQHGPDHRETAKYLHNLVWLLNQSGDVTEAYALARRPRATIAWETGLHPPVPARLKQPPAVAGKDDAKAKKPDAGKPGDKQRDSCPAAEIERWGGLQLGTPGARR